MGKKDYVETLKTGLDFMGKMAVKGVSSISKGIKGDDSDNMENRITGLYYQRHLLPSFGDCTPRIEYFESMTSNRMMGGFVKKLIRSGADKSFVNACFAYIYGDADLALNNLAEAIAAEPQFTDCYFLQGALFLAQKKYLRAEESFSKARLLPTGLGAKIRKFIPSLRLSMCITESITFTFFPDILGLNLLLAISQRNAGKLAQAIATLEQILSVMPESQELIFFLSAFYYEAHWDDKITEVLKELVPENNLQVLTVEFLIEAFIQKKNITLAEGILQRSIENEELDPYIYCDLQMLLGKVAKKAGRNAEGSAYMQKVKKSIPDHLTLDKRLGLSRQPAPLSIHAVYEAAPPPMPMPMPEVAQGSRTVLASPDQLPGSIAGAEPGRIKLKSRDGHVDMILPESLTIGREQGDLLLRWDASSSRMHARIFMDRGQIWVEDIGSSNGTWLNQHRITEKRAFNKGDNLLVGKTEFYLE